jgi:hypothetical protein
MVGAVTLANIAPDQTTARDILRNAYAAIRDRLTSCSGLSRNANTCEWCNGTPTFLSHQARGSFVLVADCIERIRRAGDHALTRREIERLPLHPAAAQLV